MKLINILIFFLLNTTEKHRLMYKKSDSFVYVFVTNCQFFANNSVTVCPIKLKTDMLHHINNTFRNTVFWMLINVSLRDARLIKNIVKKPTCKWACIIIYRQLYHSLNLSTSFKYAYVILKQT